MVELKVGCPPGEEYISSEPFMVLKTAIKGFCRLSKSFGTLPLRRAAFSRLPCSVGGVVGSSRPRVV